MRCLVGKAERGKQEKGSETESPEKHHRRSLLLTCTRTVRAGSTHRVRAKSPHSPPGSLFLAPLRQAPPCGRPTPLSSSGGNREAVHEFPFVNAFSGRKLAPTFQGAMIKCAGKRSLDRYSCRLILLLLYSMCIRTRYDIVSATTRM